MLKNIKIILSRTIIPSILLSILFVGYYLVHCKYSAFSFIGLIVSLLCLLLAQIIFANSRRKAHVIWGCFNISVAVWGFGCFLIGVSGENYIAAIYSWKLFVFGITFIPVFCYHFTLEYINKKSRYSIILCYSQAIFFTAINLFSDLLVNNLHFLFGQFYYLQANALYSFYFLVWLGIVFASLVELYQCFSSAVGAMKVQSAYLFYGMLIGFLGGGTTAPQAWGIYFYPAGHFLTCVYAAVSTYSIFKYQLVDIKIVITRIGVFVAVYSIVLGLPFALVFGLHEQLLRLIGTDWWMTPLVLMTILATAGPFLYIYVDKKAEEKILQEQNRYQSTLRQASIGMGRIKDLSRLVALIVHIVTRTVRIEHSMIYLFDPAASKFQLKGMRARQLRFSPAQSIDAKSSLVENLLNDKNPIVYEEIKQRTQDYGDLKLARLETEMRELAAALVVPSFVDKKLLAIMVLGKKTSNKLYTQEDLAVFTILANQAALAIENAMFYEDMKQTHAQLFKAEKMATIGTMADGLSHQINNRLHALGFIAGDALDTIKLKKDLSMTPELKEVLIDLEHALNRIQENVVQGGEVVRGLLKYTRKGEEGFAPVDLNNLVDAAVEMAQFKIKKGDLVLQRDYTAEIPRIKGNFTQLQEVFFNLIDNAYDAMVQRKHDLNEEGYKPILRISAQAGPNGFLSVYVQDNGIGIKEEDKNKVFTPFFTTKLSSKKGTGLGLYVIQKLIEENHEGKVVYKSVYKQGTTVELSLPVYVSAVTNSS